MGLNNIMRNQLDKSANKITLTLNSLIKDMRTLEKQMITIQENQCEQEDYFKEILKILKK